MSSLIESLVALRTAYDDTARVEVIVERLALAEELRSEDDVVAVVFLPNALSVAYRDGRLDDHDGLGVYLHNQFDNFLYMTGIEVILVLPKNGVIDRRL